MLAVRPTIYRQAEPTVNLIGRLRNSGIMVKINIPILPTTDRLKLPKLSRSKWVVGPIVQNQVGIYFAFDVF